MTSAPVIPINSVCTLCGGSGWRYVSKFLVERCQCRSGKVVRIDDVKTKATGEA